MRVRFDRQICGDCRYFLGCGDFDLCCKLQIRRLCYTDTLACANFAPRLKGSSVFLKGVRREKDEAD